MEIECEMVIFYCIVIRLCFWKKNLKKTNIYLVIYLSVHLRIQELIFLIISLFIYYSIFCRLAFCFREAVFELFLEKASIDVWEGPKLFYCSYSVQPICQIVLTHLFPMHPFFTHWKHQKTLRFSDVFKG